MKNITFGDRNVRRHEQQQPNQRVMHTLGPGALPTMLKQGAPGEMWQTLVMHQARSQSGRL